ncbi:hypothetical protein PCE1_002855 [Barthelona sp. PCE]
MASVDFELGKRALQSLIKREQHLRKKAEERDTLDLFDNAAMISLRVALKHMCKKRLAPKRIQLAHKFITPENTVLVIVSDSLEKQVEEIVIPNVTFNTFTYFKDRSVSFEQKRNFASSYDYILVDKVVYPNYASAMGKIFKQKRGGIVRFTGDIEKCVHDAMNSTFMFIPSGTTLSFPIGDVDMGEEALLENLRAAIHGLERFLPHNFGMVQTLGVKTATSIDLPFYHSLPKEEDVYESDDEVELDIDALAKEADL